MYLAMLPGALFQQNFSILKALLGDYHATVEEDEEVSKEGGSQSSSSSSRAGSVGKLGMSVGFSFMIGPLLGGILITEYRDAVKYALLFVIITFIMIIKLPDVNATNKSKNNECSKFLNGKKKTVMESLVGFLDVKAARTSGGFLLMGIRVCMGLAFHVFQTIWIVSLKERFDFGPADHGKFMSFIGLSYALSQGFIAKTIIKRFGDKKVPLILLCSVILGIGRYVVFQTRHLILVYIVFGLLISALGTMNTILTTDTSNLASSSDLGGLYGILGAVESVAGMIGPIVGGLLARIDPVTAPLYTVVSLYMIVFLLVLSFYEKHLMKIDKIKADEKKESWKNK